MLVHSVFFWLKEECCEADRDAFRKGFEELREIESVSELYVGSPVGTDRPVVDNSYAVALTVIFNDFSGLSLYQDHPRHKKFIESFSRLWDKIIVYDSD